MKTSIYTKLFSLKEKVGKISKDSKNPFFKSKYFDINALLENIEPLIHDNNLVLLQPILNNKVCTKIVDIETGDEVVSEIELPNLSDPQKLGSAITYYRRYTLQSLLGIQAEDDDGNKAAAPAKKPVLNEKGYEYLIDQGSYKEIKQAIATRTMTAEQLKQLSIRLEMQTA
jgi:hypothetical protein